MIEEKQLQKLVTNQAIYKKGMRLYQEGDVKSISVSREEECTKVVGYVEERGATHKTEIRISGTKVEKYQCTCTQSKAYPGMCQHGVATVLQSRGQSIEEQAISYQREGIAEHTGNVLLESLIQQYTENYYSNYGEVREVDSLRLVPAFSYPKEGAVWMSLAIGKEKLYPVTDLYSLGMDILHSRTKSYGKGQNYHHSLECFKGADRRLAKFLMDEVEHDNELTMTEGAIPLRERTFATFFKECKDWGSDTRWVEESPEVHFVLQKEEDQFVLKLQQLGGGEMLATEGSSGEEQVYPGISKEKEVPMNRGLENAEIGVLYSGRYLYHENTLYKVDRAFIRQVWPVLRAILCSEDKQMVFQKEELGQVKRYILDGLGDRLTISVGEDVLGTYTVPDLEMKLHLDTKGEKSLVGKMTYTYGEISVNPLIDKAVDDAIRDRAKENYIEGLLMASGFESQKGQYSLKGEALIYDFLTEGLDRLMALGDVYVTDALRSMKVRRVNGVSVGVTLQGEWLDINMDCLGIPKEELAKLLHAYSEKKKYYRLKNGDFVDLTGEGMEELGQIVEGLNLTDKDLQKEELLVPKYRALYLEKLIKEEKLIVAKKDTGFQSLTKAFEDTKENVIEVPESMAPTLRSYQVEGYKWMKTLGQYGFGGILADDMGLGKTLQMIAVLKSEKGQGTSIVVCPTSLVFNWVSECEKFASDLAVCAIVGTQSQRELRIQEATTYDVIVTSYDSLKRDSEKYSSMLFNYCIIDEAQYIKNSGTQNAKAVKSIQCTKRMALTGTPIENRLSELWSLFDFVMPGYLFGEGHFRKTLELPIMRDEDEQAMGRLRMMIAPFILRRLKKEVLLELPDKTERVVYTELAEEQKKVYMSYAVRAKEELLQAIEEDGMEKSHIKMLACLTRLRQICCHPSLCIEDYTGESGKLSTCMELVENTVEAGHKVLLFSQFTTMLEVLAKALKKRGITYSMLKGDVKAEKRRDMVTDFNEGDTQVFLISLKAGGVGLNLTSADVVIHYDPWWNRAAENQATDRAYRIGQMNNVQVFKLITKDTLEEKIKAMQDKKQDLTENILSTEHKMISQLTTEEILELFG